MKKVTRTEILQYLLRGLPESEEFDFLAICFSSDENELAYEMARDDLIENYLKNKLTKEDRQSFETHFLLNPLHRELLKFSKLLRELLSRRSFIDEVFDNSERSEYD